jgi:hypothetical protein
MVLQVPPKHSYAFNSKAWWQKVHWGVWFWQKTHQTEWQCDNKQYAYRLNLARSQHQLSS